jgi:long-chain acyl-CoA synthetase
MNAPGLAIGSRERATPDRAVPSTLPALLERNAAQWSGRVALRQKAFGIWHPMTWRALAREVRVLAQGLKGLGLTAGEPFAILGDNRREWVALALAAQRLGCPVVPIQPGAPEGAIAAQLDNAGVRAVSCQDQEQADKVIAIGAKVGSLAHVIAVDTRGLRRTKGLVPYESLTAAKDDGLPFAALDPDGAAFVLHSMGTADRPRPLPLTHRAALDLAVSLVAAGAFSAADSTVSFFPLAHPAELALSLVVPLWTGGCVNFPESRQTVLEDAREIAPTSFAGPPRVWQLLHNAVVTRMERTGGLRGRLYARALARGGALDRALVVKPLLRFLGFDRVRFAASFGAPASPEVAAFFARLGVFIRDLYSFTEAGGPVLLSAAGGSAALPLDGVGCRLGPDRELFVRPRGCAHWVATGDLASASGEGFRIEGRLRDAIPLGGGRLLAPARIESALKRSPYIREALVTGGRAGGLTALVQIDADTVGIWAERQRLQFTTFRSLTEHADVRRLVEGIVFAANDRLAAEARIDRFVLVPAPLEPASGQLTPVGAVRRHAVRNHYADQLLAAREAMQPAMQKDAAMRIAIIGAGNVGGTLGKIWAAKGHEVTFGVRSPDSEKALALVTETGGRAKVTAVGAATAGAEIVLLATPWEVTESAVRAAGDLAGKVLVDCTNPLSADLARGLEIGHTTSGAERVSEWAKGARVVKAFNSTGWNIMADPAIDGRRAAMFVCGDDAQAKNDVIELAMDAGMETIDAGDLKVARLLEPYAAFWIHLAYRQGLGREYAFVIARRRS